MNQLEWTEGTLHEAEEKTMSTSALQTLIAQERAGKRVKEDQSSPMTDSSRKQFMIHYKKKTKLNMKVNLSKESKKEVIIITEETSPSTQTGDKGTTTTPTNSTVSKDQKIGAPKDQQT